MGSASLRCAWALLPVVVACTPDTEMIGTLDTSSGSTAVTSSAGPSSSANDDGTSQSTGTADEGAPSSSESMGAQDSSTSFDPPADVPVSCDVEIEGNATVSGATPLGEIDMMFGWYASTGGGKCPSGYVAWFLPSAAAGDTQLDDSIDMVPDALRLRIEIPESGLPGDAALHVEHWIDGDVAEIDGMATLEMGGGPMDMDTRLIGSFAVDEAQWALSGEFSLQWCELLHSGPCGA